MFSPCTAGLCFPKAPFPLALFLISVNHIPHLLLLTQCDFFFFFFYLSGREGKRKKLYICQITNPNLLLGSSPPHLCKGHEPQTTVLSQDMHLNLLGALTVYRWFWIHQPGDRTAASGALPQHSDGSRT